ncbi:MAG TPA: NAD-dependent epimerase/dehydratase family protein, partial [Burkholderiaceae bacterium]|nr:NAD-dependent epimerase/dehydratase family protein [Burkholderiaceae bacterium]
RHVLVVGGAGYVGNVLIRQLLSLGYRVRCLDALYYPTGNTIAPLMDNSDFSFVRGDLRNVEVVRESLQGITDVVLLAALVLLLASAAAAPWPEPAAAFEDIQDTGSGRWQN